MTATQPTSTDDWRVHGRDDAPMAQRAIIRFALASDHGTPGYACGYASSTPGNVRQVAPP